MNIYKSNESQEYSPVYLRKMRKKDYDLVVAWRNSDKVRRRFIYQEPFTVAGQEVWVRTMIDTGKAIQMMICESDTNDPIGCVYLRDIDHLHLKAELGIFIGENKKRGKGYGTYAAKLMLEYGFHEMNLHRIFLRVLADNEVAIKSYQKAGFVQEGYLKDDVRINGFFNDIIWMAAVNPDETDDGNEIADPRKPE
ncbi:MAG: GNAT family N-acetyltransferase [Lachnospiraceae bacterium]|jgi:RimJ/RimL family protein N-acetyltransferase|nr:GNAT family N-acetyltransferase [Lachnospiraceae bacterium]